MIEIKEGQVLEAENLFSFRGAIKEGDLELLEKELNVKIAVLGAKQIGEPIIATYSMDSDVADVEMLIPIDKNIKNMNQGSYKEKIKIVNAIKIIYKGPTEYTELAINKLNAYIEENNLRLITPIYSISKFSNENEIQMEIYVGINPNII